MAQNYQWKERFKNRLIKRSFVYLLAELVEQSVILLVPLLFKVTQYCETEGGDGQTSLWVPVVLIVQV